MIDWGPLRTVVEEKVDGANSAISFENGQLVLQSRGHILSGGPRERLFERMWPWAYERVNDLQNLLGGRYVLFGEWMQAKHRVFYDALPDRFLEFDIWDRNTATFLSTRRRRIMLAGIPVVSVAVLWEGVFRRAPAFGSFIGPSNYKTDQWKSRYRAIMEAGMSRYYADSETDDSNLMEGVYIKIEDQDRVIGRMKVLRGEFEKIRTDDARWGRRPIFQNELIDK